MAQICRSGLLGVRSRVLMLLMGFALVANGSSEASAEGKICVVRSDARVKVDESSAIVTPNITYGGKVGLSTCVNTCSLHPDCQQAMWDSSGSKCYRNKGNTAPSSESPKGVTTMRCEYHPSSKDVKVCKVHQMIRHEAPPQEMRTDAGDIKYGGSAKDENACLTACTYADGCMEATWSTKDKKCYPSKQALVHDVTEGEGDFWTVQCVDLTADERDKTGVDAQRPQVQALNQNGTDTSNSTDASKSSSNSTESSTAKADDTAKVDDALLKTVKETCTVTYDTDTCGTKDDRTSLTKTIEIDRAAVAAQELPTHRIKYSKDGSECKDGFDHKGHLGTAAHLLIEDGNGAAQSIDLAGKSDQPVFISKLEWSKGCRGTKSATQMSKAEAEQRKKLAAQKAAKAAAALKAQQEELKEEQAEKAKAKAKAKAAEGAEKAAEAATKKAKNKEQKEKAETAAKKAKVQEEKDKAEELRLRKEGEAKKEKKEKAKEKADKAGSKQELTEKGVQVAKLAKEKRNKNDKWYKKGHVLFAQGIKYQGLLQKFSKAHNKLDAYHYKRELETYTNSFPSGFTAPLHSEDGVLGNQLPAGSDPIDIVADPDEDKVDEKKPAVVLLD